MGAMLLRTNGLDTPSAEPNGGARKSHAGIAIENPKPGAKQRGDGQLKREHGTARGMRAGRMGATPADEVAAHRDEVHRLARKGRPYDSRA